MAPPGAAELRQRLGLMRGHMHDELAPHGHGGQEVGGHLPEDEEAQLGFSVAAADCACRPAVGTIALHAESEGRQAGPGSGASASSRSSAGSSGRPAALAAVTLDAGGQLRLLRQRWPRHEPTLHQRCSFLLGEPAVALLSGSLSYQADGTGSSSLGSGAAAGVATTAAGAAAGEMVAVTASGSVFSLLPLDAQQAQQLSLLQRALTQHPAAAPLSGGSYAKYRGLGGTGKGGSGEPPLVPFVHPPPANIDAAAAAEVQPPASPGGEAQQAQQAGGLVLEPGAEQLAWPVVGPLGGLVAAEMQPGPVAAATATLALQPAAAAAAGAATAGPSTASPRDRKSVV